MSKPRVNPRFCRSLNYLFICSRNKWRSRTAETIFKNNGQHQVRSAGTEPSARIRVSEQDIGWADIIFVMEPKHRERLLQGFADAMTDKQVEILHIPDEYQYMDEELVVLLQSGVNGYF